VRVRSAVSDDVPEITRIFNHWIACDTASFYTSPRPEHEIAEQIARAGDRYPWLVAIEDDVEDGGAGTERPHSPRLLGAAWSKAWNPREAYAGSVEVSVYVAPDSTGRGVGGQLYCGLIPMLDDLGYRTLLAGITLPNPTSVRLHEKFGFVKVAHFREVGYKFDRWLDVGYWQRLHRSPPAT